MSSSHGGNGEDVLDEAEDNYYDDDVEAQRRRQSTPITVPGPNDVLLGRGGGTINHHGNVKFRQLVGEHKMQYFTASKFQKPRVAQLVVELWSKMDPPGRFLERPRTNNRRGSSASANRMPAALQGAWYEVDDKKAREKASQCLRERTAEVMPYIKKLREQQRAQMEQGVHTFQQHVQLHEEEQRLLLGYCSTCSSSQRSMRCSMCRHPYEEIPDHGVIIDDGTRKEQQRGQTIDKTFDRDSPEAHKENDGRCTKRPQTHRLLFSALSSSILIFLALNFHEASHWFHQIFFPVPVAKVNHETTPTLLSVVDPITNQYVAALDNSIYERLKLVRQMDQPLHAVQEYPTLTLDRTKVAYGESLTVSWTEGITVSSRLRHAQPVLTDDSILVLVCADDEEESSNQIIMEATTLAQAAATSQRNLQDELLDQSTVSPSSWYIARFPILRYHSCHFNLYQSLDHWYLLAHSPRFSLVHRPTAIHLALTQNPSEMVVQFVTSSLLVGTPVVSLVHDNLDDTQIFRGTTDTYMADELCQAPANITEPGKFLPPGQLHAVLLTGLQPNTRYHYRVGLQSGQGTTLLPETYEFMSALPAGGPEPFAYLVYGDQGCPSVGWGKGGLWTAAMAMREVLPNSESPNQLLSRSVHHFGDLSYARGAAHIWDEWFEMNQVFTAHVPLMIGVGNHEYDHTDGGGPGKDPSGVTTAHGFMPAWGNFGDDSGGECGVPTAKRFRMPQSNTSNGVFWYSYDFGSVHTVVLSSEHDLGPDSPQHLWLTHDLSSVQRSRTPWVVVELHRPLYEGEAMWDQNAVGVAMRYEMEDLLHEYQVDLVLAGHYHAYHRTCDGLYRSQCHQGGPMHITVGSAGAHLDDTTVYESGWSERFIMGEYAYGRVTVANASAMHFELIKAGEVNDTSSGDVLDDVWIMRHR